MKYTPIVAAITAICGFLTVSSQDLPTALLIALIFAVITAGLSVFKRRLDLTALMVTLIFAASGSWYALMSGSAAHKSLNYINRYVSVSGVVISEAEESADGRYYRHMLRVKKIDQNGEVEKANDTIILNTPSKYRCGDSITARGIIKTFPKRMNENGFDVSAYYKSLNIFARMYTEDTEYCEKIRVLAPYMICGKYREFVDDAVYRFYDGDTAAIISAVLTGNMRHFSEEFDSVLEKTAFKRLLHPAYIHSMLLLAFMGLFAGIIPRAWREWASCGVLLVFALLSSAHIGFARCMTALALTFVFQQKAGHVYYPDVLAYVVIGCIIFTPMIIFNASFVLSTVAALVMWAFKPCVMRMFRVLPKRMQRGLSVAVIAAVFYTPLASFYFDGLCIYSFVLPFIMTPLVVAFMLVSVLALAMLSLWGAAPIAGAYVKFFAWVIYKLPYVVESLPLSRIVTGIPGTTAKLFVICAIFTAYYALSHKYRRAAVFSWIACGLSISMVINYAGKIGTTEAVFVNVGQGDGSVVHTAFGSTIIIDGGGGAAYSDYDPGEAIFVPYLTSHGYSRIDAAFISHFHKDHVQGVIAAIRDLKVKTVYAPAPEADWDEDMLQWKNEVETAAKDAGTEIYYISEDTEIVFEKGLSVRMYAQDDVIKFSDDGNDSSMLMKVCYGGNDILYTGDLTTYAEHEYIRTGTDVSAKVLKVAHHGSKNSTCTEWVGAVNPLCAVISCGENNSYGHPHEDTLERLDGVQIFRTDEQGDIKVIMDKEIVKSVRIVR